MLDHERLIVYQRSIEFAGLALAITKRLPKGNAKLADQLWRSSTSIPTNIAEGVGKRSTAERRHYYVIARGSAFESASHLDIVRLIDGAPAAQVEQGKQLLLEIIKMLSAMTG